MLDVIEEDIPNTPFSHIFYFFFKFFHVVVILMSTIGRTIRQALSTAGYKQQRGHYGKLNPFKCNSVTFLQ